MGSCHLSRESTPAESSSTSCIDTPATEPTGIFAGDLSYLLQDFELKHVLVTGGLGFIGSHTTLGLLNAGYNVIVVDDFSNSFRGVFDRIKILASEFHEKNGSQMPSLRLHPHDYRDTMALRSLLEEYKLPSRWAARKSKITGVIHFAAHKAVEESIKKPLKYYANNVSGMIDFAKVLSDFDIKTFILSSSATVYGTLATAGLPLTEELCVHKEKFFKDHEGAERVSLPGCIGITSPYGRTKWICEAILADLATSDPEWTIVALRYFNPVGCDSSGLLGEDPRQTPTNLFPVVVKVLTGQYDELQIFGADWDTEDGTAIRDFIHVTDLAEGHVAALAAASDGKLAENFRCFNLGTGRGHSVLDVVNAMERASSSQIPRKVSGRRPGDIGSCVAIATRAQGELAWKSEKTLEDACADTWNFLHVSGQIL